MTSDWVKTDLERIRKRTGLEATEEQKLFYENCLDCAFFEKTFMVWEGKWHVRCELDSRGYVDFLDLFKKDFRILCPDHSDEHCRLYAERLVHALQSGEVKEEE